MPLWVSCGSLVGFLWACRLLASGRLVGALVGLVGGVPQGAGYPQNIETACFHYGFFITFRKKLKVGALGAGSAEPQGLPKT